MCPDQRPTYSSGQHSLLLKCQPSALLSFLLLLLSLPPPGHCLVPGSLHLLVREVFGPKPHIPVLISCVALGMPALLSEAPLHAFLWPEGLEAPQLREPPQRLRFLLLDVSNPQFCGQLPGLGLRLLHRGKVAAMDQLLCAWVCELNLKGAICMELQALHGGALRQLWLGRLGGPQLALAHQLLPGGLGLPERRVHGRVLVEALLQERRDGEISAAMLPDCCPL